MLLSEPHECKLRSSRTARSQNHEVNNYARLQVADFMGDRAMVEREAAALGHACYVAAKSDTADALGSAVLSLPHHLQHAAFSLLLAAPDLPGLLDTLPAALHCALLNAHVQRRSGEACTCKCAVDLASRDSDDDWEPRGTPCGANGVVSDEATARGRCLFLRREPYTASACTALLACIPLIPSLSAVTCSAALPAAQLTNALSVHSALTHLDLSGAKVAATLLGSRTFARALPACWPRLSSLRVGFTRWGGRIECAAAPNVIAAALVDATTLTSLELPGVPLTPELAQAVGGLTQLAELQLTAYSDSSSAVPQLASLGLQRLHALRAHHAGSEDQHGSTKALRSVATCALLTHLDLDPWRYSFEGGPDLAALEFAALSQLESLRLGEVHDSSLQWPGNAAPVAACSAACRCGIRALPRLQQLTALSIGGWKSLDERGNHAEYSDDAAYAVGAVLPLLTRLARLSMSVLDQELSTTRALALGWSCAPALRALTRLICSDDTLLPDPHASAAQLRRVASLDMILQLHADEIVDGRQVARPPWLSGQLAQLSALRTLGITGDDPNVKLAILPTLAALSATTSLRQLVLDTADLGGVDLGVIPLCSLTALSLQNCHAAHAMSEVAPLTELRKLQLNGCSVTPGDVSAFVQRRGRALASAPTPLPHLDLDLRGESLDGTELEELLGAAEPLGLRYLRAWHVESADESALAALSAFNMRWAGQRKCICPR